MNSVSFGGIFSRPRTSALLALWPLDSGISTSDPCPIWFRLGLSYFTYFLASRLADNRLWDFLASITPWANSHNKSLLIYLSIYPVLWRTLATTSDAEVWGPSPVVTSPATNYLGWKKSYRCWSSAKKQGTGHLCSWVPKLLQVGRGHSSFSLV